MRHATFSLFLLSLLFQIPTFSFAQEPPSPQYSPGTLNIALFHNRPTEAFEQAGYGSGWGMSMDMLPAVLLPQSPVQLQLGARLDYSQNGRFKTEMDLLEPTNGRATYRLTNQQVGIYAMTRLITRRAAVRFYADALIGTTVHSTVESYDLIGAYPGYEDFTSDAVINKANFTYGGATGMEIRLNEGASLDLRVLYKQGSAVSFAELAETRQVEQSIDYPMSRSRTSQLGFQVGFTFDLYESSNYETSLQERGCCCCEPRRETPNPDYIPMPPPTDPRPIKPQIRKN